MSKAEKIFNKKYIELSVEEKKQYHNILRKESFRKNPEKTKQDYARYRENKKIYINRLETLLHNAIILLLEDYYTPTDLQCEIGISEKELNEIINKFDNGVQNEK